MKIKLSVGAVVLSGFFQVGVCAASVTSVVPKVAKNVLPIGADSAQKLVSTAKTGLLDLVNNFKTKGAEQQPLPNPEPSTLVKAKNSALAYISKPRVESGWLKVHDKVRQRVRKAYDVLEAHAEKAAEIERLKKALAAVEPQGFIARGTTWFKQRLHDFAGEDLRLKTVLARKNLNALEKLEQAVEREVADNALYRFGRETGQGISQSALPIVVRRLLPQKQWTTLMNWSNKTLQQESPTLWQRAKSLFLKQDEALPGFLTLPLKKKIAAMVVQKHPLQVLESRLKDMATNGSLWFGKDVKSLNSTQLKKLLDQRMAAIDANSMNAFPWLKNVGAVTVKEFIEAGVKQGLSVQQAAATLIAGNRQAYCKANGTERLVQLAQRVLAGHKMGLDFNVTTLKLSASPLPTISSGQVPHFAVSRLNPKMENKVLSHEVANELLTHYGIVLPNGIKGRDVEIFIKEALKELAYKEMMVAVGKKQQEELASLAFKAKGAGLVAAAVAAVGVHQGLSGVHEAEGLGGSYQYIDRVMARRAAENV